MLQFKVHTSSFVDKINNQSVLPASTLHDQWLNILSELYIKQRKGFKQHKHQSNPALLQKSHQSYKLNF